MNAFRNQLQGLELCDSK